MEWGGGVGGGLRVVCCMYAFCNGCTCPVCWPKWDSMYLSIHPSLLSSRCLIRIRRSVPVTNGSGCGSGSCIFVLILLWSTRSRLLILLCTVLDWSILIYSTSFVPSSSNVSILLILYRTSFFYEHIRIICTQTTVVTQITHGIQGHYSSIPITHAFPLHSSEHCTSALSYRKTCSFCLKLCEIYILCANTYFYSQ
jgi:hypothetical protein